MKEVIHAVRSNHTTRRFALIADPTHASFGRSVLWERHRQAGRRVDRPGKSPIAAEALRRIGELYAIEAGITGRPVDLRLALRQEQAVPHLVELRSWLEEQSRRLSSKTDLAKAIRYALTRWDALTRYRSDGRLGIDNNPAERSLRGIALTRKNFLFLGSDAGGARAAILYTVLESAKLNGLDPEAYLAGIIAAMAGGHPITRLDALLPWNWVPEPHRMAA